jgi:hypothetical protein
MWRERGVRRRILKLPAIRNRLHSRAGQHDAVGDLCEAYGEASETLERLRRQPAMDPNSDYVVLEYELICGEIEEQIVERCCSLIPRLGP